MKTNKEKKYLKSMKNPVARAWKGTEQQSTSAAHIDVGCVACAWLLPLRGAVHMIIP